MSKAPPDSGETGPGAQSIWARPQRGTRGPVPAFGREAIAAAAVGLADTDGLKAVSMRAVASALGTAAGSLYRYLSSREDLLDLMIDMIVGELAPYPRPTGDWLGDLITVARRQLALYRLHPWLAEAVARASAPGPKALAYFDHCLRILQPLRCGATAKFEAIGMLNGVVTLFARTEAAAGSFTLHQADPAAYPHIAAAFTEPGSPVSGKDLFERTLRAMLTGLLAAEE